jgi:hypothetical protein
MLFVADEPPAAASAASLSVVVVRVRVGEEAGGALARRQEGARWGQMRGDCARNAAERRS